MISIESFDKAKKDFDYAMQHIRELKEEVDLRPNMLTDDILSSQIRSLDFLLVEDIKCYYCATSTPSSDTSV